MSHFERCDYVVMPNDALLSVILLSVLLPLIPLKFSEMKLSILFLAQNYFKIFKLVKTNLKLNLFWRIATLPAGKVNLCTLIWFMGMAVPLGPTIRSAISASLSGSSSSTTLQSSSTDYGRHWPDVWNRLRKENNEISKN
jgi:hypothetical protein